MRWKQTRLPDPAPYEAGKGLEESVDHRRARNRFVQSRSQKESEEHKPTGGGILKNMFPGLASMIQRSFVFDDGLCPLNKIQHTPRKQLSQRSQVTFLVVPERTVHVGFDGPTVFNESVRLFPRPSH